MHCLTVAGTDLWCCTGSGAIAVFDLTLRHLKNKVKEQHMREYIVARCPMHETSVSHALAWQLFSRTPTQHAERLRCMILNDII